MLKFFVIVGASYAVINAWIIWWLWRALEGAGAFRLGMCLAVLALAAGFPVLFRLSGDSEAEILSLRVGALWTGIFLYVFVLVLALDAHALAARLTGLVVAPGPRLVACGVVLGLPLLLGIAGSVNALHPVIRNHDLTIRAKGAVPAHYADRPLVIAAISDLHLGRIVTNERLRKAVALIAPREPDLVLFLGDVLDDHIRVDPDGMRAALDGLRPRLGIWGVVGNHEYIAGDIDHSLALLERGGIAVLRDEARVVDDSFLLVGRDDAARERFSGTGRKTLAEILATVPEGRRALPAIVLDHQPSHLKEAEAAGAALQLSGHTHNGQIWPFNLVTAAVFENARGHSMRGDTHFVVSVGAGTWGPPMRNTARPEVLLLRVRFAPPEKGAPDRRE